MEPYEEEQEAVSEDGRDDDCESRYINFAGHHQGPEAYLRWEQDMEDWFSSNQISEEEKTSYAEDTLTEDAFRIYEQDAYSRLEYEEPDASWEEMKQILYQEFVEDVDNMRQYNIRVYTNPEPRRLILASRPSLKVTQTRAENSKPRKVSPHTSSQLTETRTTAPVMENHQDLKTIVDKPLHKPLLDLQGNNNQSKSSKLSKSREITCHERGHYAVTCPSKKVTLLEEKTELSKTSDSLVHSDLLNSNSSIMHLSLPKSFDPGIKQKEGHTSRGEKLQEKQTNHVTCLKKTEKEEDEQSEALSPHTSKERIIIQLIDVINVSLSITRPMSIVLNSDIMHLFLVQNAENISGYKDVKEVPLDKHLLLEESTPKKTSTKATKEVKDKTNQLRGINHDQYHNRGVILSYLLKVEPPDVPPITKYQPYQGKTRSSQKRMKANLLSLSAGDLVSRSKLLQEGEYDEDIKSSSAQEHGDMRLGDGSMKLRRAKETCEQSLAQMEANANRFSSTITWRTHSTHLELTTKKNQPKRIPYEEDIPLTTRWISSEPEGDQHALNEAYRPNQDELSNEFKCFGFSVHNRRPVNWNQTEIHFGLKVIQLINRMTFHLPYLETHGFSWLQTKLWRPGDTSKHSRDTSNHPEDSSIILPCTSTQGIRRILLNSYFPFLTTFTLGVLNHQRLFPYPSCCVLKLLPCFQNVPRYRTFLPKLSRYKLQEFPYLTDFFLMAPTAIFF